MANRGEDTMRELDDILRESDRHAERITAFLTLKTARPQGRPQYVFGNGGDVSFDVDVDLIKLPPKQLSKQLPKQTEPLKVTQKVPQKPKNNHTYHLVAPSQPEISKYSVLNSSRDLQNETLEGSFEFSPGISSTPAFSRFPHLEQQVTTDQGQQRCNTELDCAELEQVFYSSLSKMPPSSHSNNKLSLPTFIAPRKPTEPVQLAQSSLPKTPSRCNEPVVHLRRLSNMDLGNVAAGNEVTPQLTPEQMMDLLHSPDQGAAIKQGASTAARTSTSPSSTTPAAAAAVSCGIQTSCQNGIQTSSDLSTDDEKELERTAPLNLAANNTNIIRLRRLLKDEHSQQLLDLHCSRNFPNKSQKPTLAALNKPPRAPINGEQFAKELQRMSNYEILDLRKRNSIGKLIPLNGHYKSTIEQQQAVEHSIKAELLRRKLSDDLTAAPSEQMTLPPAPEIAMPPNGIENSLAKIKNLRRRMYMNSEDVSPLKQPRLSYIQIAPAPPKRSDNIVPIENIAIVLPDTVADSRQTDVTEVPQEGQNHQTGMQVQEEQSVDGETVEDETVEAKNKTKENIETENCNNIKIKKEIELEEQVISEKEEEPKIVENVEKASSSQQQSNSMEKSRMTMDKPTPPMLEQMDLDDQPSTSRAARSLNKSQQKVKKNHKKKKQAMPENDDDDAVFKKPKAPASRRKKKNFVNKELKNLVITLDNEKSKQDDDETINDHDTTGVRKSKRGHVPLRMDWSHGIDPYTLPFVQGAIAIYSGTVLKKPKLKPSQNQKSTSRSENCSQIELHSSSKKKMRGRLKKTSKRYQQLISDSDDEAEPEPEKMPLQNEIVTEPKLPSPKKKRAQRYQQLNSDSDDDPEPESVLEQMPLLDKVVAEQTPLPDKVMAEPNSFPEQKESALIEPSPVLTDGEKKLLQYISYLRGASDESFSNADNITSSRNGSAMHISSMAHLKFKLIEGIEYSFYDTEDKVSLGYMRFPPLFERSTKKNKLKTVRLIVVYGEFDVVVEVDSKTQKSVLKLGEMVEIKMGVPYNIINRLSECSVIMVQLIK